MRKFCIGFLCVLFLAICRQSCVASNCFTKWIDDGETSVIKLNKNFTESLAIQPFQRGNHLSSLCISGTIAKHSEDYLVRIILKDEKGEEYLVLEAYEEIFKDSIINLSDYCEETAILESIVPSSLLIFLRDASLYMKELSYTTQEPPRDISMARYRREIRKRQSNSIIERINKYNQAKGKLWVAGESNLSKLEYSRRKTILNFSDDEPTGGYEYYVGGIFEASRHFSPMKNNASANFVDSFDWRYWQGKNMMTQVKDQEWSSFCSAFAAIGCAEAIINLYYNRNLNLDLSEQEIADCSHYKAHKCYEGLYVDSVMKFLINHGVCSEGLYPMDFHCGEIFYPICKSEMIPTDSIAQFGGYTTIFTSDYSIKYNLLKRGPLVSGFSGHAMTLVGWGTLQAGDSVYYYNKYNIRTWITTVEENDPKIGYTYWIFKNSYGEDLQRSDSGYTYVVFDQDLNGMILPFSLDLPTKCFNYSDEDILVEDLDGDGYYNWGLSPNKPSTCPVWVPNIRDDDDTDSTKVTRNDFGFLTSAEAYPHGYPTMVSSNEQISGNNWLTADVEIERYATLTITDNCYCMGGVKIICDGGTLVVDGGTLANAEIVFSEWGGSLIVKNGGTIYLKNGKDLNIPLNCTLDVQEGKVCQRPKRI